MSLQSRDGDHPAADLVVVVVAVVFLALLAFTTAREWRLVAITVGLPVVLTAPGYALVAAIFPEAGDASPATGVTSWTARLLLSVAGSVIAVAVVGVVLDFSVWGFQRGPVVLGLCGWTLAATGVAWVRRRRVPVDAATGVSASELWACLRSLPAGETPVGALLTILVLGAAIGAVGVVAEDTRSSAGVTEFYVLGPTDGGEFVAGAYPDTLTAGTPTTVGIGVGTTRAGGFEGRVVATVERVAVEETTPRITQTQQLGSFDIAVAAGESRVRRHTVRPTLVGDDLRLTYRLYEDGSATPIRRVQLRLTVEPLE